MKSFWHHFQKLTKIFIVLWLFFVNRFLQVSTFCIEPSLANLRTSISIITRVLPSFMALIRTLMNMGSWGEREGEGERESERERERERERVRVRVRESE